MTRRVLVTARAPASGKQHTKPCGDCPWRRDAVNGWLGPNTAPEWIQVAHSDGRVECHTIEGAQCAGAAIYRRNTAKLPPLDQLRLDADRVAVFSNRFEFLDHHAKGPTLPEVIVERDVKPSDPPTLVDAEEVLTKVDELASPDRMSPQEALDFYAEIRDGIDARAAAVREDMGRDG